MSKAMQNLLMLMLLTLSSLMGFVHAEVATATDSEAEELIIARDILQKQNTPPQNNSNQQSTQTNTAKVTQPQIANDLAEGQFQRDLPSMNTPVIDQAKLLTPIELEQLNQQILRLYNEGEAQIGVVIVPTTGQEDIFSYSMRVAEKWGLGSAKYDNGLLMTVAINDRRIQILTGYGLEGVLPDIVASRIIRDQITPYFKEARYAEGIQSGLSEVERILNLDPEIAAQAANELRERQQQAFDAQKSSEATWKTVIFIILAGVFASMFFGKKLSASTAAVAGVTAGLVNGMGLVASLMIGAGVFFLLITSIAQTLAHAVLSSSGGGRGGGGFGGGGGGFGGGGASGSW